MIRFDEKTEIGKIYGDLTIIDFIGRKSNNLVYLAKCNVCGREKEVWIKDIRKGHGTAHKRCSWLIPKDEYLDRFRSIWSGMVARCENIKEQNYKWYGGKGIKHEYPLFIDFYDDMFSSYVTHCKRFGIKNTTLERIDFNKGYVKNNIKWDTWENQLKNTSRTGTNAKKFKAIKGTFEAIGTTKQLNELLGIDRKEVYKVSDKPNRTVKGYTIKSIK